ncbi:YrhK-like protein [Haloactinospora alba]|uniref:YrhK-like protein n=1 Tax=Haloactinospora alba TaxID=405555 RepID=A0A543N9C6_9ACTN|nr:YrhK-like protein [Haloactinospora alba]
MSQSHPGGALEVRFGHHELLVRRRYEALSIANDILIALWFIVGSVMFFWESWTTAGTWCFLAGSVELLIRPMIRLARLVHIQRARAAVSDSTRGARESAQDF